MHGMEDSDVTGKGVVFAYVTTAAVTLTAAGGVIVQSAERMSTNGHHVYQEPAAPTYPSDLPEKNVRYMGAALGFWRSYVGDSAIDVTALLYPDAPADAAPCAADTSNSAAAYAWTCPSGDAMNVVVDLPLENSEVYANTSDAGIMLLAGREVSRAVMFKGKPSAGDGQLKAICASGVFAKWALDGGIVKPEIGLDTVTNAARVLYDEDAPSKGAYQAGFDGELRDCIRYGEPESPTPPAPPR